MSSTSCCSSATLGRSTWGQECNENVMAGIKVDFPVALELVCDWLKMKLDWTRLCVIVKYQLKNWNLVLVLLRRLSSNMSGDQWRGLRSAILCTALVKVSHLEMVRPNLWRWLRRRLYVKKCLTLEPGLLHGREEEGAHQGPEQDSFDSQDYK